MHLFSVSSLRPNMVLATNVFDDLGCILLGKGTILTEHYIRRLAECGVASVFIQDDNSFVDIEELIAEDTRSEAVRVIRETFSRVRAGRAIENDKIKRAVNNIMEEILANREILIHLAEIRSVKDHTFNHSVSVSVLSLICGLSMGYTQFRLRELGIAGLLHDIGKSLVPPKLITETGLFGEKDMAEMRNHTTLGYNVLIKSPGLSPIPAMVAWQHHERHNGSGYPRGIRGSEIVHEARIISIADVYDALSTDRPYRARMLPHQIVELIEANRGTEFDPDIATEFILNLAPFPIGSTVTLNNGVKGTVIEVTKSLPTRPKVKILFDENGCRLSNDVEADLMRELTLFIVDVTF